MISEEERKAIEDLKHTLKISDEMFEETGDRLIDTRSSLQIQTVLNLTETQNKMIELMAEEMKTKEYEYEDMCLYSEDCNGEYCEKCIIEYFRNKAKESE